MTNRLLNSYKKMNLIFIEMLRVGIVLLFLMSLQRFVLFWTSRDFFVDESSARILEAFFIGLRFDLLILGFVFIPIVLALNVFALTDWWSLKRLWYFRLYWVKLWGGVCLTVLLDSPFYLLNGRHMVWAEYRKLDFSYFNAANTQFGVITMSILMIIIFVSFLIGSQKMLGLRFDPQLNTMPSEENVSELKKWSRLAMAIMWPFFVVALAARGTVAAHHLELAHSQISGSAALNQLVLNASWCLDK